MRTSVGWKIPTLAEIADGGLFSDGDWIESKDQDPDGNIRLTQLADIGVAQFRDRSNRWLRHDQAAALGCTFLEPGDILIARMPDPIGRSCLVPENLGAAVTAVDVAILRIQRTDADARFVMWAINSPHFHAAVVAQQSGTTRKRISRKHLAALSIPLPPVQEQRRIVEILEDHLSRLSAGKAGLGDASRRLQALEAAALDETCDGVLVPLAELAKIQGGIQKQPKRAPGANAYPFLRVANVTKNGLELDDIHKIELFDGELERLQLERGDLLVVEGNGSPAQIGRAALWDGSIPGCVHQNHLIRVRPGARLFPEYLEAVWNSPKNRRQLTDLASSSSGLHTLSVSKLKSLMIPVPPLGRQHDLVKRVEDFRHRSRRLNEAVTIAVAHAEVLRRTLLQAAFSGQLLGPSSISKRIEELAGV